MANPCENGPAGPEVDVQTGLEYDSGQFIDSASIQSDALAEYDRVLSEAINELVLAQRKLAQAANLDIRHRFTGTGTGSNPLPTAVSALDLVIDRAKAGL